MKKLLRRLAIWFESVTGKWVIDKYMWEYIDDVPNMDNHQVCRLLDTLSALEKKWGNDPDITRAKSFVTFLRNTEEV